MPPFRFCAADISDLNFYSGKPAFLALPISYLQSSPSQTLPTSFQPGPLCSTDFSHSGMLDIFFPTYENPTHFPTPTSKVASSLGWTNLPALLKRLCLGPQASSVFRSSFPNQLITCLFFPPPLFPLPLPAFCRYVCVVCIHVYVFPCV